MPPEQSETLLGLLIGSGALIGLVAIIGGFLHARSKRLLAHAERMKALELGRGLPPDEATALAAPSADSAARSPADQCFSVAGKVGFWGFVFAVGATTQGSSNLGVAIAIAAATGAIGVTSVICGAVLAAKGGQAQAPGYASAPSKGYYDPEGV